MKSSYGLPSIWEAGMSSLGIPAFAMKDEPPQIIRPVMHQNCIACNSSCFNDSEKRKK